MEVPRAVVIGVHTPEFSFEKERGNVEEAVRNLKVTFPVAIDSNYRVWQAFNNQYWPAQYFIDGKGRIRYHHFGEGEYADLEAMNVSEARDHFWFLILFSTSWLITTLYFDLSDATQSFSNEAW